MSARTKACRWVLVVFGVGATACGVALAVRLGALLDWIGWLWYDPSGGKLFAAAILAFGVGALLAAVDPYRNRVMVQTLLVFGLAGVVLLGYRLLFERETTPDAAWAVLGVLALVFAAFCICYPQRDD